MEAKRGEMKEGRKQEDEAFAQEETRILPRVAVRRKPVNKQGKIPILYEYANKKSNYPFPTTKNSLLLCGNVDGYNLY